MVPYEYRNAVFKSPTMIDMEVNHPAYGWIPYTAIQNDDNEMAALMFEVAKDSAANSSNADD